MIWPAVKALCESTGFFIFKGKEEFSCTLRLLYSHVLDVDLWIRKVDMFTLMIRGCIIEDLILTCADLYASLISTSLQRDPSHKKTCSPLSSNIMSSSAKSSWQKSEPSHEKQKIYEFYILTVTFQKNRPLYFKYIFDRYFQI